MKHLIFSFLIVLFCSGHLMAQQNGNSSIISIDSIIEVVPGSADFQGVIPGTCRTVMFDISNIGNEEITISALYLDDASGIDEFELVDPEQVPFELDTADYFAVRVDYCPDGIGESETELLIEYGEGKVIIIPLKGSAATIFDMDWCDDFSGWQTGEWIGNGWTGSVPANLSVYPSNTQDWGGTIDGSVALFLRNRQQVDDIRMPVEVISPGIVIQGDDPVISWMEMSYSSFNGTGTNSSPRNLYISTDGENWDPVDSYLTSDMPDPAVNPDDWFRKQTYSLIDYVGRTIWWKFELVSNNNEYIYWILDNVCVQQRITVPILKHSPDPVELGGVQLGDNVSETISFTNIGVSVAKIKSIEIQAENSDWSLVDENTYPVEIHDGDWAFAYNGTDKLTADVVFTPKDIGISTASLVVTWGLYEDKHYIVPLIGEGLSCETAEEAVIGENIGNPDQWFTYTAEKFQIVNIHNCDERNSLTPGVYTYAWDTWLTIYDECDGNIIAENDDYDSWDGCFYNRQLSHAENIVMNAGETIKIFWDGIWKNDCETCDDPFFWFIEPNYPIDGDVCETAIPLTLPVINHFGSTVQFADDYDISPCSPFSNYMDGNDKVYSIELEYEGYLTGSILGAYGSIHVLDMCPVQELEKRSCKAFASGPNGGQFEKRIQAGSYYVIVSTWSPPQTVDYLMNLSFQGLGVDNNDLLSSVKVYPNPTDGRFTVSINNPEAKNLTLELIDISGKAVYRKQVKGLYSFSEEIDGSAFAGGVYYFRINDGDGIKYRKVIMR